MLIQTFIHTFFFVMTSANTRCSSESSGVVPKYYLMEKCYRSKLGIAAKANFTSLISCQRLGIEKKALAINFSPQVGNSTDPVEYTCEALKCAESEGGLSLSNDTRYDYYSIYAKPLPNVKSTCVPATGMFFLLPNKLNFTQAQVKCRNISGVLADVTSEQRTEALAQMLTSAGVDAAYVGMWSANSRGFHATNGDSLECTTYRAWAPSHPKRIKGQSCVMITRQKMWKTIPCKTNARALCELIPGGPYRRGSIFVKKHLNDTDMQNFG